MPGSCRRHELLDGLIARRYYIFFSIYIERYDFAAMHEGHLIFAESQKVR